MHPADLMGPKTAVLVLIFAAVFLAAQSASGLVRSGISRRAVNRRLATAERTSPDVACTARNTAAKISTRIAVFGPSQSTGGCIG